MNSLRAKFALLALVFVALGAGFQYFGYSISINQAVDSSNGNPGLSNAYVLMAVMTTIGGVCVAVAVALAVGVIVTYVIEATLDRMAGRGESPANDESEALAAYGSNPELL